MPYKPPKHKPSNRKASDAAYAVRRKLNPALAKAAKINRSSRWRRVRERFLKLNPLCCDPFGTHATNGETVTADHVHHVEPLKLRPDLAVNRTNLRALCTKCHAKVCATERAGGSTQHLFPPVAEDMSRYILK